MGDVSAIALFCADVREEKRGTVTVVGIYPDNLNVPKMPGAFPSMAVYVRIHLRPAFDPGSVSTRIILSDGEELARDDVDPELLRDTLAKARLNGAPTAGLITTFVFSPFHVSKGGRITAIVSAGKEEYIAGSLNLGISQRRLLKPPLLGCLFGDFFPPLRAEGFGLRFSTSPSSSFSSPVATRITLTALPITSAGRFGL